jgi:hypothetical protein
MNRPLLRFERRTTGVYPYLFHAGPFYWPVQQEAIASLTSQTNASLDAFRAALTAAVGVTPYLAHQLNAVLAGLDDRDGQLRALQTSLGADLTTARPSP